jgi:hypothetical protein
MTRALALAAGVIEPDRWPEAVTYLHSTKSWQIAW